MGIACKMNVCLMVLVKANLRFCITIHDGVMSTAVLIVGVRPREICHSPIISDLNSTSIRHMEVSLPLSVPQIQLLSSL